VIEHGWVPLVIFAVLAGVWLYYRPWFPAEGSERRHAFTDAMYAGVVSGLVTGIMVGIFIWWVQERFERRREREMYVREVTVFRENLRDAMQQPHLIFNENAQMTVPQAAQAAIAVIRAAPLDLWLDHLPHWKPLLGAAKAFHRRYVDFTAVARQFDAELDYRIRHYLVAQQMGQQHLDKARRYVISRILRATDEELTIAVGHNPSLRERFEAMHAELVAMPDLVRLEGTYVAARRHLQAATQVLRTELDRSLGSLDDPDARAD
jgi:hypothetical protein